MSRLSEVEVGLKRVLALIEDIQKRLTRAESVTDLHRKYGTTTDIDLEKVRNFGSTTSIPSAVSSSDITATSKTEIPSNVVLLDPEKFRGCGSARRTPLQWAKDIEDGKPIPEDPTTDDEIRQRQKDIIEDRFYGGTDPITTDSPVQIFPAPVFGSLEWYKKEAEKLDKEREANKPSVRLTDGMVDDANPFKEFQPSDFEPKVNDVKDDPDDPANAVWSKPEEDNDYETIGTIHYDFEKEETTFTPEKQSTVGETAVPLAQAEGKKIADLSKDGKGNPWC